MKRLLPRVVPEAVGLLGLLVLAGASCAPESNVKPGAPVLLSLAIVENGGVATTITPDTAACSGGADGGTIKTQDACSPGDGDTLCKLADDVWCRCAPDGDDPSKGTWNCDPFSPMSVVIATFDRLLLTDPLDPGDAATTRDDIADITVTPTPAVTVGTAADYQSNGSPSGALINLLGPIFFGNYRSFGPNIQAVGDPALPTGSSVGITFVGSKLLAKDGKTQFIGENLLADASIKFKTDVLKAEFTIPMAPPPPPPAEDDGGADGGVADAAPTEAGASDGGTDAAVAEAGASEGGTDAAVLADASTDAPKVDAAVVAEAGTDAAAEVAPPAPPEPGAPVPADMNMTAVVLTFNNLVDAAEVKKHITVTEDGKPFTVTITADPMAPNKVNIAPADVWAKGKTYVITVDADVTDIVGDKLGGNGAVATFMMAK